MLQLSTNTVYNRNPFTNLSPEIIDSIPGFDEFFSFVSPHAILSNAPNIIANKKFCLLNFTPYDINFTDELYLAINKHESTYKLTNYSLVASYQRENGHNLIYFDVRNTNSAGRHRMEKICLNFMAKARNEFAHGRMRGTKIADKDKFLCIPRVKKLMESLPSYLMNLNFEVMKFYDLQSGNEVHVFNFTSFQIHFSSDRSIWVDGFRVMKLEVDYLLTYQIPGDLQSVWLEYIDPRSSKLIRDMCSRELTGIEPYTRISWVGKYCRYYSNDRLQASIKTINKIAETYILLFCSLNQAHDETDSNLVNFSSLHVCGVTKDILNEVANKMLLLPNKKFLKFLGK
jgi:hypothetical protein